MSFDGLLVTEIFHSLQGETSLAGLPFAFIRLTGCNLRCTYCDTSYAFKGGKRMSVEQVLAAIEPFGVRHVLVTGGEPLIQRRTPVLVRELSRKGYLVSVETHGETSIEAIASDARVIMDIKAPSSGMCRGGFRANLQHLKPTDEIKFVIASESDYRWATALIEQNVLPACEILFSPAIPASDSPGTFDGITPRWLAESILRDRLDVRMQIQLHKTIWGAQSRGV